MKKRIFALLLALCLLSAALVTAAADTPAPTIYATEKGQALAVLPVRLDEETAISALEENQAWDLVMAAIEKECVSVAVAAVTTTDEEITKTIQYLPSILFSHFMGQTMILTTDLASLELAPDAIRDLGKADGTVKFTLEQSETALTLTITADRETITTLTGGLILKPQGKDPVTLAGSDTVSLEEEKAPVILPISYTDLPTALWAREAVAFVTAYDLMKGTGGGKFSPEAPTTRAMIWAILGRISKADVDGGSPWYAKAQTWASTHYISDGSDPMDTVSREQLAVMLWRLKDCPESTYSLDSFTDADQISGYALEGLRWACETGILKGQGGALNPQGPTKRAEAAAMLMRLLVQ